MANNRTYEIMYIAAPETADDDVTKLNEAIVQLIEKEGGSVTTTENMGRRKLAYPIDKKTEGHYVLFEVQGSGSEIAELERRFRVNDAVIRFITVRVDEDRKRAEKLQAKRDARTSRRNAANNRGDANQENQTEPAVQNQ
ncbi:MAG: 30S ribosomal protein S6 [Acidobacteria bacterium]|nr:30S ribosomal protein S6 [Acidobacteriota bacterium]